MPSFCMRAELGGSGIGRQHDHRDRARAAVGPEQSQDLLAGDVRKVQIEQHDIRIMPSRQLQRQRALHRRDQLHAGRAREDALDELEVREVVLHVEDARRAEVPRVRLRHEAGALGGGRGRPVDERQLEEERRALAGRGVLDVDPAAHGLREAARERRARGRCPRSPWSRRRGARTAGTARGLLAVEPGPVSTTSSRRRPGTVSLKYVRTTPPGRLYLMALLSRLSATCLRRCESART